MDWSNILSTDLARIAPSFLAVLGLGWWLSGQFNTIRNEVRSWVILHEKDDQLRHEQNLHRFEKISVALARLGSDNGSYGSQEKDRDTASTR